MGTNLDQATQTLHIGLARKWRPQTFDDLVGQAHITRTLANAIKTGRISQGYLFTGTRGVGKTSSARIFAKAIRCEFSKTPGIPCNQCQDCIEISEGRSINVLEIDGASNNGVDAIREIRENAKYLPSSGRHKIYIVDEVHMLTTAAFNALLKTLEEPPPHLVFIFATTDPQKIPATVLSRCQRFDFKRVSLKDLSERLRFICASERIAIDDGSLSLLAREAEGSVRDGISLLDQVAAMATNNAINPEVIAQALGLIDKATLLEALTCLVTGNALGVLEAVGKIHIHGFDLKQFGRELLRSLRMIMVVQLLSEKKVPIQASLLEVSDVDLADFKSLIGQRSHEELDLMFSLLNHGLEDVARSSIPKTVLDVLLIRICAATRYSILSQIKSADDIPSREPVRISHSPAPSTILSQPQTQPQQQQRQSAPQSPSASIALDSSDFWPKLVAFVKSQKPLLGTILENISFQSVTRTDGLITLLLGYSKEQSFYKEQLQMPAYTDLLLPLLKNFLGCAVRLDYKEVSFGKSIEMVEKEKTLQNLKRRQQAILESEAMRAAHEVLGGRLEKLEIRDRS